jgi:hypothetical protein
MLTLQHKTRKKPIFATYQVVTKNVYDLTLEQHLASHNKCLSINKITPKISFIYNVFTHAIHDRHDSSAIAKTIRVNYKNKRSKNKLLKCISEFFSVTDFLQSHLK